MTASLLLMRGADVAAAQRILRHSDPRLTTETYRPGSRLHARADRSALFRPRAGPFRDRR